MRKGRWIEIVDKYIKGKEEFVKWCVHTMRVSAFSMKTKVKVNSHIILKTSEED
jgi:hypothetical protein